MKNIEILLEDEVYEALMGEVIPLLDPKNDRVSDGISKWIKLKLGMDIEEPSIEGFLNAIPENFMGINFRKLCKELIDELRKNDGIVIVLPSREAWSKYKHKWIIIKKKQPRTRRQNLGWIESRDKGFVVYVYIPEKKDYQKIKINLEDVMETTGKTIGEWKEMEFSEDKWTKLKAKILTLFDKAYKSL